jgi:hypothetical protein
MRTWTGCLLILVLAGGTTTAQKNGEAQLSVVRDGDTASIVISRGGSINSLELLRLYAATRNAMVMGDPKKFHFDIHFTVPEGGRKLSGTDLDVFVQDGLEQSRIIMYWSKPDVISLCPAIEAASYGESMSEADLDKANPAVWARVVMRLHHAEPNAIRGAMQNVMTRSGGQVNPIPPATLMLIEGVDRMRSIVKSVREIDNKQAPVLKTLEAAEGADVEACVKSLRDLFPPTPGPANAPPRFTAVVGTRRIVAMAREDQHALIAEALAKLK